MSEAKANAILACIQAHRSVRAFRSVELDDNCVEQAVRAAQMASSSSHVQAYSLLRVRDGGERRLLRELCGDQAMVEEAGAFFVLLGDQRRHRRLAQRLEEPYVPNLETFLLCAIDASLFAQNLVLAFESMGLGCCYVGGLRTRLADVDRLLELPPDMLPLYGLCVGEPAEEPMFRPRLPLQAVLFEGRCPSDAELDEHIDTFDETMATYYEQRGASGRNWSGGVSRKFRLAQREELARYYASKGARLA